MAAIARRTLLHAGAAAFLPLMAGKARKPRKPLDTFTDRYPS